MTGSAWNGCVPDPELSLHDYELISRLIIVANIAVVLWGAISTFQFSRAYRKKHGAADATSQRLM